MAIVKARKDREKIIEYIEAVLLKGYFKKAAYIQFIDPEANPKTVHALISSFEKSKEFQAIYEVIISDDNLQLQGKLSRVKSKFYDMVEKNLDTLKEVHDKADTQKQKAAAVRLGNETITALGAVSGSTPANGNQPGGKQIDKSAAVS